MRIRIYRLQSGQGTQWKPSLLHMGFITCKAESRRPDWFTSHTNSFGLAAAWNNSWGCSRGLDWAPRKGTLRSTGLIFPWQGCDSGLDELEGLFSFLTFSHSLSIKYVIKIPVLTTAWNYKGQRRHEISVKTFCKKVSGNTVGGRGTGTWSQRGHRFKSQLCDQGQAVLPL